MQLKERLQQWRERGLQGADVDPPVQRPRSFRPSCIVPRLYLGAAKDVQDVRTLRSRLLPDKLLMVVSTCDPSDPPRMELRQIAPTKGTAYTVKRLAVCSWEELEKRVVTSSFCCRLPRNEVMVATAEWLKEVLKTKSLPPVSLEECRDVQKGETDGKVSEVFEEGLYLKLCLPWKDESNFAVRPYFAVATALIHATMNGIQGAVVCYCMAGKSRSATLTCALLLYCCYDNAGRPKDEEECSAYKAVQAVVEFVREVRLCVSPNEGFIEQLRDYASDLLVV